MTGGGAIGAGTLGSSAAGAGVASGGATGATGATGGTVAVGGATGAAWANSPSEPRWDGGGNSGACATLRVVDPANKSRENATGRLR